MSTAPQAEEPYRPPTQFDKVPNEPLRIRFETLGVTAWEVAEAAGWTRSRTDPRPNAVRVKRALGLLANQGQTTETVTYVAAVALARALDLDPIDAGV